MKKAPQGFDFCILGGSLHLMIRTGEDLRRVPDLEFSSWAMTLIRTDSVICDKRFLDVIDSDKSGKIRSDEVRDTLVWMLDRLSDLSGVVGRSDKLYLSALNRQNPEANEMYKSIQIALANLQRKDQEYITLDQISDDAKIVQNTLQNGDGVIPPDQVEDKKVADCIRTIMTLGSSHKDLTGIDGVNAEDVASFRSLASTYIAWKREFSLKQDVLLPYGDKTVPLYHAMLAIRDKMDEFYKAVDTLHFASLKVESDVIPAEKLVPNTVQNYLESSYIANPVNGDSIGLNENLNPLWRSKVEDLFRHLQQATNTSVSVIGESDWVALKNTLTPYDCWINRKNTSIFDPFDFDLLCSYEEQGCYAAIETLIHNDIAVSHCLDLCGSVAKLIVLQQNMMDFVNNYVSLYNLFDEKSKSMIQKGKLVMDGRVFTLCTMVPNPAEHKKIVSGSDICVMYVNAYHVLASGVREEMKLAVAVTSGHVRNIFIGKTGVFVTPDGNVWTAQVFDFVKQPVSIGEAIVTPFYKFSEFFQQQVEKLFSSRSKKYEENIAKDFQKKAEQPAPGAAQPAKPVPTPATAQPGMMPGSMVLMGGGIGLAAIGSSFAFITKSLQGVSFSTVLAVILGILLIFGAPVLITSLVKLFRRNLSRFFEANGYAVNVQIRLSPKMGSVFTYVPKVKKKIRYMESIAAQVQQSPLRNWKILWTVLALIVLGVVGYFAWPFLSALFSKIFCACHG